MNKDNVSVVITSIAAPNDVMRLIAEGCLQHTYDFYVIGDVPSPTEFELKGCKFLNIQDQLETGFKTAPLVPKRHYARKNLGYLTAISGGAQIILETDDDNYPISGFWDSRERVQEAPTVRQCGWLNIYGYFSDVSIWPRGLPLDAVRESIPNYASLQVETVICPIQQGLANENPDVDAIYRLLLHLPINFRSDRRVSLGPGCWCPFNSQNTTWFEDAFPLLYLPAYCSFRMTDIWRSFVAQRVSWECGWHLLFHEPTVFQKRNDHSLMRDFEEEIPGYLQNRAFADILSNLPLRSGQQNLLANLYACYEELVRKSLFESRELKLLEAWILDLSTVTKRPLQALSSAATRGSRSFS